MSSTATDSGDRPNIRIQIENNVPIEPMDVDASANTPESLSFDAKPIGEMEEENDEEEEGEIVDDPAPKSKSSSVFKNNQWLNTEGGFVTGIDLFSEETKNKLEKRAQRFGIDPSETRALTDKELEEIHKSLGVEHEGEEVVRFDTIHMLGTNEMSTQDVFHYFAKYGPASIEWICDNSCNVVWADNISPVRALHGMSKPIQGMPIVGSCDPFKEKGANDNTVSGRSVLLVSDDETSKDGKVSVSDIDVPIPNGYWRLGESHPKAKFILLRFAKMTDKKPFKAERFSEYYKKYGNPNYGYMKGIISDSARRRIKALYSSRAKEAAKNKDPWGILAENWNKGEAVEELPPPKEIVSKPPISERLGNIRKRLGSDVEENDVLPVKVKCKSKPPRMRMYADEEEEKIKLARLTRVKEIIDITRDEPEDLRAKIGRTSRRVVHNEPPERITRRRRSYERPRQVDDYDYSDEKQPGQRSRVTMILKTVRKPSVASVVRSQPKDTKKIVNHPRGSGRRNSSSSSDTSESDSEDSDSSNSSSSSDDESSSRKLDPLLRPGFISSSLAGRLKLDNVSPLKIEINNDLCSKIKKEKD